MSKSGKSAKTASKNNPTLRRSAEKVLFNGKEIKPILCITADGRSMRAAEFADSKDLVTNTAGVPMTWKAAKSLGN